MSFQLLSWSEASPIKSSSLADDSLDKINTDDFKIIPNKNGLSYTISFRLKSLRKTYLVYAKILAITESDGGKVKEKSLFDFDPSTFIKLKGYKVMPKDSSRSNIMKILFPRQRSVEIMTKRDMKRGESKTNDPITSSIREHSAKDLKKDFIEVDDILLVRDPSNIDSLLKNELTDQDPITPAPKSMDLQLNRSLRIQKTGKDRNFGKNGPLNRFLQPTPDRGLFKREDSAFKNEESATVIEEDSSKVDSSTQTVNDEPQKEESESVGEPLQAVQDDTQASSTVENVKQDVASSNSESSTVPMDSSKDDTQPMATESVVDTTEKVGESQATNESENKEEPSLGAPLQSSSDSATEETPTENVQQKVEEPQDQTTQASKKTDSITSENDESGMVGASMQTEAVRKCLYDSNRNFFEIISMFCSFSRCQVKQVRNRKMKKSHRLELHCLNP